jgi:pyruvate/2-oxoglutarate dehydrogenase complex dihydrolipoamide dehydrogenase (E3) component
MEQADVIVIGSGQGGVPLAEHFAREGKRVLLYERAAWGGSCVNWACTPTKALLAAAHMAAAPRRAEGLGVSLEATVDFPAVMRRIRGLVERGSEGVRRRLERAGVHLVHAEARFVGERTVSGGDVTVSAPLVVLDVGKGPAIPPIDGLDPARCRTYMSIWDVAEQPRRMVILGAGQTGMEMGQAFRRLGSEVHIVEALDRPLATDDLDVSRYVGEALYKDGVQFTFSSKAVAVQHGSDGVAVRLENGDEIAADVLLVATGRRANVAALDLDRTGVDLNDDGTIRVDQHLRTTCDGVYAIGDTTGQPAYTHVAWEDHRRLLAILAGQPREKGDRPLVYGYFTDPQVGRMGLTLAEAQEQGLRAREARLDLRQVARARLEGRTRGVYKLVVDEDTERIVGATLIGPEAAELVHVILAHVMAGATWRLLEDSVYLHPSYAEDLPTLARELVDKPHAMARGA